MKNLLATLAAAAILTSGVAFAQTAPAPVTSAAPHAAHHKAKKAHHHHHHYRHHHGSKAHKAVAHKGHAMKKVVPSAAPSAM